MTVTLAATCATCPFFTGPKKPADGVQISRDTSGVYRDGKCRRFPKAETKEPHEVCGEHPDLVAQRVDVKAMKAFAEAVDKLSRAQPVVVKTENPRRG